MIVKLGYVRSFLKIKFYNINTTMLLLQRYQACTKCLLRSLQRQFHVNKKHFNNPQIGYKNLENKAEVDNLIEKYHDKIIYNTFVNNLNPKLGYIKRKKLRMQERCELRSTQSQEPLPVVLKYFSDGDEQKLLENDVVEPSEVKLTQFPFGNQGTTPVLPTTNERETENAENFADNADKEVKERQQFFKEGEYGKWMTDYENYEEAEEDEEPDRWKVNYGTPDPRSAISNVPCGGCGALLHCKDTAIPGYIPSEIYKNSYKPGGVHLKALVCQRCHFLNQYDLALQVRVTSEDYPKVLETIKEKRALIILMVDLLDFPCSIWPGIVNTLGARKPIVVVGNKIDLLPRDSRGYLKRIEEALKENVRRAVGKQASASIKHVALISAKTGWGVEELITKLQNSWGAKIDVYLVGCTNVGKSSLFNCLLQSDYCKIQAVDLVQRATTSMWPGTTLNLLKFPILRPSGWRLYVRTKRLQSVNKIRAKENKLIKLQSADDPKYATLLGHLDRTFLPERSEEESADPFAIQGHPNASGRVRLGISERDPSFASSRWCYDTPGVVQPDQIIHLLTAEELTVTLPREVIRPQTFGIRLGQTIFIAGIGRLDYIEGPGSIRLTVFRAETLPITMCSTEDAALLYEKLLGTEMLEVPKGSEERLNSWPGLKPSQPLKLTSEEKHKSCGDVVLSSAGWIAVTCDPGHEVTFTAWTPEARGIYLRKSLLPYAVALRGRKLRHSPAYESNRFYVAT